MRWLSHAINPEKTITETMDIMKSKTLDWINTFTKLAIIIPIRAANIAFPVAERFLLVTRPNAARPKNIPDVIANATTILVRLKYANVNVNVIPLIAEKPIKAGNANGEFATANGPMNITNAISINQRTKITHVPRLNMFTMFSVNIVILINDTRR